jgi:Na+/H+-dicarboxylate symporter
MGRSATNVVGNAVASSVVARWEGDLGPELSPEIEPLPAPSHVRRTGKIHNHF